MPASQRPHWQLPPGVTRSLWEYTHALHIAHEYDDYFALHKLFELDEAILARHIHPPGLVADLGCGTGRALVPLVRRGMRGLAVDLSEEMLRVVREKAELDSLPIDCLQANLVELDCLRDDTVDAAICLFSTLGMIRGRENRRQVLRHVRRILKPGGPFVLHVHNYWFNLFDPGGPWWIATNWGRSLLVRDIERGDKYFTYRQIPNMFMHVFRRRELERELRLAGFKIREITLLDAQRQQPLARPWLFGNVRSNGWIVVAE